MSHGYSIERRGNDIFLELRGHFSEDEAADSTTEFVVLVGDDTVRMIVNIENMKSYDTQARVRWQEVLAPFRKQISTIIFVGDAPPLVRMAGSAVALAVGVRMRFVAALEEIEDREDRP